uniref:Golgin subfamily A conserved domain-containing protein n=1 Tax=Papio anubis TaxID=9555 RepID=A0A096NNH2_PAPAN
VGADSSHEDYCSSFPQLKEYWQRNSPGGPAGVKKNRKTNGSVPETATSASCHSPEDPGGRLTLRFHPIPQGPINLVPGQACPGEHWWHSGACLLLCHLRLPCGKSSPVFPLHRRKKANNETQKAKGELEVSGGVKVSPRSSGNSPLGPISTLITEESKDLAGRLQQTLQCIEELEQALSAVPATQEEKEISFSSRSQALIEWQLEQSTQEKARLKAQLTQMKDSLKQAHLERDEYAQHLKGERAQWQQRMRKMWQEVCTLKKEKKDDTHRVEELKRSLSKLKNQMAKPLPPEPPAVPPEEELQHLRKELERVSAELQAHVENHQHVSLLNQTQKERLGRQEERLQQLAEPQSGVEELNNENKSALHLEQQVEELQEKLDEVKETVTSAPSKKGWEAGDGGGHLDSEEEEGPRPMPSVPEDLESWEAMSGFMDHREEMADLSELVEKPELPFIEYWGERCHQNVHQLLTEAGGCAEDAAMGGGHHQAGPAQGGDEGEAAGAAGDAVTACADHNNELSKLLTSSQNPAHEPGPGAPAPQELRAANQHGDLCEVSLTDSAETGQGEAKEGSPNDNPTAQSIVQDQQEHPALGSNLCVPFFCWAWLRRRR